MNGVGRLDIAKEDSDGPAGRAHHKRIERSEFG